LNEQKSNRKKECFSVVKTEEIEQVVEQNSILSDEQKERLRALLERYRHLFIKDFVDLPGTNVVKHKIELLDEVQYVVNRTESQLVNKETIKKEVDRMLAEGVIEPSNSPLLSLFPRRTELFVFA
jgi:hypothetical protein